MARIPTNDHNPYWNSSAQTPSIIIPTAKRAKKLFRRSQSVSLKIQSESLIIQSISLKTQSVSLHSRDYDILPFRHQRYSKNMVNVWYFITYKYAKVPLKVEWHSDYSKDLYGKCQFLGQNSALWCNPSSARGSSFPRKFWNYANPQNIERFPFFIGFVGNIGWILSTSDDQRCHHCDDEGTLKGTLKGKEGVSILCRHRGHQGSHQPTKWSHKSNIETTSASTKYTYKCEQLWISNSFIFSLGEGLNKFLFKVL